MSRPRNLYHLQKIDSQLDKHQKRLQEIAQILANNAAIKKAQSKADQTQKILDNAKNELQSAETKVKDQRIKIGQNEANLYGGKIRNPKELQGLQDEVAALKRFLSILEDRQLEAMLHVDEMSTENEATQANLSSAQAAAHNLQVQLLGEKGTIEANQKKLGTERQSCLRPILADDLTVYAKLRKQRAGVAVSQVSNQACTACGATLTAALFQAARSPNKITKCSSCGRILYAN
jgi:uncharacterized protein